MRHREDFAGEIPELLIAVTGTIASGKSTVLRCIKDLGYPVLSLDEMTRTLMSQGHECFDRVVNVFGREVLRGDGSIDRQKLLEIILEDETKKKTLEDIVHPEVFKLMIEELLGLKSKSFNMVFVEVPLLFEAGWQGFFDYVILVYADESIIKKRLLERVSGDMKRYNLLMKLKDTQMSQDAKKALSNFVIVNNDLPLEELKTRVREIVSSLRKRQSNG